MRALNALLRILPLILLKGWEEGNWSETLSSLMQRINEEATLYTVKYYGQLSVLRKADCCPSKGLIPNISWNVYVKA